MAKNFAILIVIAIILLLVLGGLFYLLKGGFPGSGLLGAFVGSSSQFNGKDIQTLELSLKETGSELEKLQKENYSLKEKLGVEEEIRIGLEQKYELKLIGLARKLENLTQIVNNFNQEITQLGAIWGPKDKNDSEEKDEETTEELEEDAIEAVADVCPVNINTGSGEELQAITGIGPVLAQRIIGTRPFSSIYDLIKVSGIGEATLQKIIDQACAYVEGDTGPSVSGPVSFFGSGGSASPSIIIVYPKILISEIQTSPIGQRFIELYNPNNYAVDLIDWYIQRKTAAGGSWASLVAKTNFKDKIIPANSYFLIARSEDFNPDILVENLTLIEDNSIVLKNPKGEIVDLVSWGQSQDFETAPFPENPKTRDPIGEWISEIGFEGSREPFPFTVFHQSIGRKAISGENNYHYQDTNNNADDFEIQTPTPKAKNKIFVEQELEDVSKNLIDYYNTPVETEIITGPEQITDQIQAIFEFQVNKEYCYFECRLNEEEWQECESPKIYEGLGEGEYVFSVRGIDLFSRVESDPLEYFWTIKILSEKEEEEDIAAPQIAFNLESTQTSLFFPIYFEITDPMDNITSSGLDGFVFRWKEEDGEWREDSYQQINDSSIFYSEQREFAGEDEKTYYFQIKAKDIAGNESDWAGVSTKISLPKNLLKNEFFEEWEEGDTKPTYWDKGSNTGDAYRSVEVLTGQYSLGIGHSFVGLRSIEQHTTSTTTDIDSPSRSYGEIWAKGTGYIRIGIKAGQSAFSHSSWEKFDNVDWTSITFDRASADTEDTWQFRIQTTDRDPDTAIPIEDRYRYNGIDLHIGAAWLGTTKPPENWPK